MNPRLAAAFVFAAALALAGAARADWPSASHDMRRSALADGTSNITTPAAFWRFRAGGGIASSAAEPYDADGDGRPEIIVISGGRVVARQPDDNDVVWETGLLSSSLQMVGLAQLDGAGEPELVVFSSSQAYVLSPSTGAIHWVEPKGEMGTISVVRAADMDGDGADDLLIQECACCAVMGPISGVTYRFASGGTLSAPEQAWISPLISCGASPSFAVVHMRSPGQSEAVIGSYTDLSLADGATGAVIATTGTLPYNAQAARCLGVDVDASPAEELLCARTSLGSGPPGSGHLLTLYRLAGGALDIDWEVPVGEVDGAVVVPPGAVADLDGDGSVEVVLAGRTATDTWITIVFDAATGAELATLPGHEVVGSARLTNSSRLVLTRVDETLHAFAYDSLALSEMFALPGRAAVEAIDRRLHNRTSIDGELVSVDVDGDGSYELVTTALETGGDITAHELASGAPQLLFTYVAPAGAAVVAAWPFDLGAYQSKLTIAQSDGNLHVLDPAWGVLSGNKDVGLRFGNYYAYGSFRGLRLSPVAADLGDGGAPGLLAQTSGGNLARLDARGATFAAGPTTIWSAPSTSGAVVAPGLDDGAPGVLAIDHSDALRHAIVALSSSGERLWTAPLPGVTLTDLVTGNLDGDGVPDVISEWGSPFDAVGEVRAIRGANGAIHWNAPSYGPYNRQPSGGAVADWNGDGIDDFIYHADGTKLRNGANGGLIDSSTAGPNWSYYTPIIDDVNGDGQDDITLTASFNPLASIDHDIDTVIWQGTDPDVSLPYATIVRCEGRPPILVSGSWQTTARLKLTETSGPTAGDFEALVLAGGQAFDTQAEADAAGVAVGQLVSPVAHASLSPGATVQVLVGSSDGWLYAVDPCARALTWSLFFNAPVGATLFADVDADGLDEILVSVSDGFLYGVKHTPLPAVTAVRDTDPPRGITDDDVDEIVTVDTLHAAWDAVATAASYEVAFVRAEIDGGGLVSDGWLDAGAATSLSVSGLPLEQGKRYFAAVRALTAAGGVSPDTLSDGVVIVPEETPPPPEDDLGPPVRLDGRSCVYFCGIAPASNARCPALLVAAALAVTAARRRSRSAAVSRHQRGTSLRTRPSRWRSTT